MTDYPWGPNTPPPDQSKYQNPENPRDAKSMRLDNLANKNKGGANTGAFQQREYDYNLTNLVDRAQKKGHVPNYAALLHNWMNPYQGQFNLPDDPTDPAQKPEEPYGFGQWDYITANKTDKLGPNGEPLPPGAKGWTPHGEAWYGTTNAFTEWGKGFLNNIFKKSSNEYRQYINDKWDAILPGGQTWDEFVMKYPKESRPESGMGAISTGSKVAWQVLNGVLVGFGQAAVGAERVMGALEGVDRVADQSDLPALPYDFTPEQKPGDYAKLEEGHPRLAKSFRWLQQFLDAIDPVEVIWDGIRAGSVLFGNDEKKKQTGWSTIKEDWKAGRILYSSWMDAGLKEEFLRRAETGDNVYLLAQELENPWAELAGQAILDPLNFTSFLSKGSKASKAAKAGGAERGLLAGMSDNLVQAFEKYRAGDLNDVQNLSDTTQAVMKAIDDLGKYVESKAREVNFFSMWQKGKAAHVQRVTGDHLASLMVDITRSAKYSGDLNEPLEILHHLSRLGSKDEKTVSIAMEALGKLIPEYGLDAEKVFSNAGLQSAKMLHDFVNDTSTLEKVANLLKNGGDDAVKTVEEVGAILTAKMGDASEKIFPSLAKMAEQGVDLGPTGRAFLHMENFANSKGMRGINSFFAHVYMGMSPGYAIRNVITNTLHIIIDEGTDLLKSGRLNPLGYEANARDVKQLLGHLPGAFGQGLGGPGGEFLRKGNKRTIFNFALDFGREGEKRASSWIFQSATKRVFRKMLKEGKAVPEITGLVEAGMPEVAARHLQSLLIANHGNVNEAAKAFRASMAKGTMNLFEGMDWLPAHIRESLQRFNLEMGTKNMVADLAKRAETLTPEELAKEVKGIFEHVHEEISKAPKVLGTYGDGPHLETLNTLRESGQFTDEALSGITKMMMANKASDEAFANLVPALEKIAKDAGIDMQAILKNNPFIKGAANGKFYESAQIKAHEFAENVWAHTKAVRKGEWKDPRAAWKAFGLPGNPPENLTKQGLLDFMWNSYYRPYTRRYWQGVREHQQSLITELFTEIEKQAPKSDWYKSPDAQNVWEQVTKDMDVAKFRLEAARQYDTSHVLNDVSYMFDEKVMKDIDEMLALADVNEIGGKSIRGVKPHLLNIIKKHIWEHPEIVDRLKLVKQEPIVEGGKKLSGVIPDTIKWLDNSADVPKQMFLDLIEGARGNKTAKEMDNIFEQLAQKVGKLGDKPPKNANKTIKSGYMEMLSKELARQNDLYAKTPEELKAIQQAFAEGNKLRTGTTGNILKQKLPSKIKIEGGSITKKFFNDLVEAGNGNKTVKEMDALIQDLVENMDVAKPASRALKQEKADFLKKLWTDIAEQNNLMEKPADVLGSSLQPTKTLDNLGLDDLTLKDVQDIIQKYRLDNGKNFVLWDELPGNSELRIQQLTQSIAKEAGERVALATPMNPEVVPSLGQGFLSKIDEINWLENELTKLVQRNYGKRATMEFASGANGAKIEGALNDWLSEANVRTAKMRDTATRVATEARNFALIDYANRRNFDTMLGMVYPYGFWYSRTYPNWMKRLGTNHNVIANFARYRSTMEKIHDDQPDWWKYNINTNELLGLDKENPMYFNMEATLNPLYGLIGVDFEDPYKIKDVWTQTLNDLNRFGPSTHTMFSVATAINLWSRGEKDAAARWAGRLIPGTQSLESAVALAGGGAHSFDPFVTLFSGGIDPYTQRRVQRSLSAMVDEGQITEEQAIEAVRMRSGDIWNMAHERAVTQRAPGQLSSNLGVGFKGRSKTDLQIDQMYQQYFRILTLRDSMSPEQFKQSMDMLHQKYPFMNAMTVSDDSEYAYNVLGRIPPGMSNDFYKVAGLNKEVVNQFYDHKGDLSYLSENDKNRFMSSMVDLGAILAIPNDATRQEWTSAKNAYKQVNTFMEQTWGKEIGLGIDNYYALFRQNKDLARLYLQNNPSVAQAMDWKSQQIAGNPQSLLAAYYGGFDQIQQYYTGQMYDEAERRWTAEIFNTQSNYFAQPTSADKKAYLRKHPELKEYWDYRQEVQGSINNRIAAFSAMLREGKPAEFRPDVAGTNVYASQMLQEAGNLNQQDPYANTTVQDWVSMVGQEVVDLSVDSLRGQRELSYRERNLLDKAAEKAGFDNRNQLIQLIGRSLYQYAQ